MHPFNVLILGFVFLLLVANRINRERAFTTFRPSDVEVKPKYMIFCPQPTPWAWCYPIWRKQLWLIYLHSFYLAMCFLKSINCHEIHEFSPVCELLHCFGNIGDQPRFLIYYCPSHFWSPDWPPAANTTLHRTLCVSKELPTRSNNRGIKRVRDKKAALDRHRVSCSFILDNVNSLPNFAIDRLKYLIEAGS